MLMIGLGIVNNGASLTALTSKVTVISADEFTSGIPGREPGAGPLSTAWTLIKIGPELTMLTSGARS